MESEKNPRSIREPIPNCGAVIQHKTHQYLLLPQISFPLPFAEVFLRELQFFRFCFTREALLKPSSQTEKAFETEPPVKMMGLSCSRRCSVTGSLSLDHRSERRCRGERERSGACAEIPGRSICVFVELKSVFIREEMRPYSFDDTKECWQTAAASKTLDKGEPIQPDVPRDEGLHCDRGWGIRKTGGTFASLRC